MRNAYNILVRNPEGKSPFGRPWCEWEDDIKIGLGKTGLRRGLYSFGSQHEQVVGSREHGNEPSGSIKDE
jgi:hypothetical protein